MKSCATHGADRMRTRPDGRGKPYAYCVPCESAKWMQRWRTKQALRKVATMPRPCV